MMAASLAVGAGPMQSAGYRRHGKRSSGFLRALSHVEMRTTVKHPGQRRLKKRRRANLAMAAFPKATS